MRILLLAHAPVIHTQRWAGALAERGHDVRLLSAALAPGTPWPGRRIGLRVPVSALRYAGARGTVIRELRDFRPDVTVAHFLPNYGFLAALAGARPLLLACWGSDLLVNANRTPIHRARARFALQRADLIHVDARVLAQAALRLGAPEARVWTRPWGVDVDALAPDVDWAVRKERAGLARILWTRRLAAVYDPESFLHALGLLRLRGIPFTATIAGEGPLRPSLAALARGLEIAGAIRFVGWVGEDALRALYHEHEIYVSMSRSDSTSQSLLEAMAAGLVPVVTDIEGNREWITHRRQGLLVPVGDSEAVACAIAEIMRAKGEDGTSGRESETAVALGPASMASRAREAAVRHGRFSDTIAETEARLRALAESRPGSGSARTAEGALAEGRVT